MSTMLAEAVVEKNLDASGKKSVEKDFSNSMLKALKIDDVDMDLLDVGKEITNSPLSDLKMSTAVAYKLFHSAVKYYPSKYDEMTEKFIMPGVITYKWNLASIEEIQKSKKYLMNIALKHENEMIQMEAFSTIGRSFRDQEDVVLWLLEQLYKPIPEGEDADIRACILSSIIMVTGDKFKRERTVAIKSLLGHPILRQRYNALKVMFMLEMTESEFLPDVIACFTTSSKSYKLNRMMSQLLDKYDVAELVPYYKTLQQAYKNSSKKSCIDDVFAKIEAEIERKANQSIEAIVTTPVD